jgi:hypothetical protein
MQTLRKVGHWLDEDDHLRSAYIALGIIISILAIATICFGYHAHYGSTF